MKKIKYMICLLAVLLCMAAFSVSASAYTDENKTEPPATEEQAPDQSVLGDLFNELLTLSTESDPLTPTGNMTLVDDVLQVEGGDSGEIHTKQFITVESKAGNTFFIVIDRAGDTENVYFLNLVDEADLLALTDAEQSAAEPEPEVCTCKDKCYAGHVDTDCPICAKGMTKCAGLERQPDPTPEPSAEPSPEPEQAKSNAAGSAVLLFVLLLAGGGGAAYYFLKVKGGKAKPQTRGSADLDDYDYGAEDEDEYDFPPSDETGDAAGDPEDDV